MGRLSVSLVCVLLASLLGAASPQPLPDLETSGDGSGMFDGSGMPDGSSGRGGLGSGDGSGGGVEPEPSCRRPPTPVLPRPASRDEPLLTEIRCHLACVQRVIRQQSTPLETSSDNLFWPSIPKSVLENDCMIYQWVQECRTGCVVYSALDRQDVGMCAEQCSTECMADCSGQAECQQSGTTCLRSCSRDRCQVGCDVYEQELRSGAPPPAPVKSPVYEVPQQGRSAGLYKVDARNTTPSDNDLIQLAATSFIFRVIQVELNLLGYYWLTSFEDLLNLRAFVCEEIVIQFAAVNKYGISSYSPSASLFVYGESGPVIPENPTVSSIKFNVSSDDRFNYWKHATIDVTWERPRKGFQYLSHYVVVMYPHTSSECGRMGSEIIVRKTSTSASIRAQAPTEGPVNGCTYEISVFSWPLHGDPMQPIARKPLFISVTNPVPLQYTCTRSWDDTAGTFRFSASWTLPNSTYLQMAIRNFEIIVRLVLPETVGNEKHPVRGYSRVPFTGNLTTYHHQTKPVSYGSMGSYFTIELKTTAQSFSTKILIPDPQTCTFDAEAIPPDPISAVNIISENFGVPDPTTSEAEVKLIASWSRASGNISFYEIRVVEFVGVDEDMTEDLYHRRFPASQSQALVQAVVPVITDSGCVFLQIRSISGFGTISNWSEPVCIGVTRGASPSPSPSSPSPSFTPPSETSRPMEPTGRGLPRDIMYVVIALGAVLLVATVVLALFVVLAWIQNKRISRRATMLKQQPIVRKKQPMPPKPHFQGGAPYPLANADKWELSPSHVIIEARLGVGAFGEVYRGTVQGTKSTDSKTVAIKLLKVTASVKDCQNFRHYIKQSKTVARAAHPHVVNMVGCVTLHDPVCLAAHYPAGGTLLAFLERSRKEQLIKMKAPMQATVGKEGPPPQQEPPGAYSSLEPKVPDADSIPGGLEPADLILFAAQIASGMEHLATLNIVHGDLACRNVYMEAGQRTVKISDFGLNPSEEGTGDEGVYLNTMMGRLPVRWMAIESIGDGLFTTASDMWAFGVTLWEIATIGGFPYPNISNKDILSTLKKGHRMECPENCSQDMYSIMVQCWNVSPTERPTFSGLHQNLKDFLSTAEADQLIKLEVDEQKPYYTKIGGPTRHEKVHRSTPGTKTAPNERYTAVVVESGQSIPAAGPVNATNPYTDHLLPRIEEEEREEEGEQESGIEVSSASECTEEDPQTSSTSVDKQDTDSSDASVN